MADQQPLVQDQCRLDQDTVKRSFSSHQQLLRLCLTILCTTFLAVVFKTYQDLGNCTPTQIKTFYAVSGSLSLLLSLSFLVCPIPV